MCLTQPATVLEVRPNTLVVDFDGEARVVLNLLAPAVRVGDDVLVGMGSALSVLPPPEAARLRELLATDPPPPDPS
jgi:hydrogenase assembly chaperone HypC/HupF